MIEYINKLLNEWQEMKPAKRMEQNPTSKLMTLFDNSSDWSIKKIRIQLLTRLTFSKTSRIDHNYDPIGGQLI